VQAARKDDEADHGERHLDHDDRDGQPRRAQHELIDDQHARRAEHEEDA